MSQSQKADRFETPERSAIVPQMRDHIAAMEQSDADVVWMGAGMHYVLVRMLGRRSGEERKVALPFWVDADGQRIVVASYAGARHHPAWYLNLADRDANAEVQCRVQGGAFAAAPEILEGAEYTQIWEALTADRPFYRDYQALTERRIPLVRLRELRRS